MLLLDLFIIDLLSSLLLILFYLVFVWMVLDVMKSDFKYRYAKHIWIVILTFLPIIGMMIYHNFKSKKKLKSK